MASCQECAPAHGRVEMWNAARERDQLYRGCRGAAAPRCRLTWCRPATKRLEVDEARPLKRLKIVLNRHGSNQVLRRFTSYMPENADAGRRPCNTITEIGGDI